MNKSIFIFRKFIFICVVFAVFLARDVFAQDSGQETTIQPPYASTPLNRIGFAFTGTPWSLGGLFDYDRRELFPDFHWTLGFELGVYEYDLVIEPRVLWWENQNMSGFYVGPKLYFVTGDYNDYYHDYQTFFGIGVEGGWTYRFPENFDLTAGVDVSLTSSGPWISFKVGAGYLF
jgi:hypothetical protein